MLTFASYNIIWGRFAENQHNKKYDLQKKQWLSEIVKQEFNLNEAFLDVCNQSKPKMNSYECIVEIHKK